MRLCVAGVLVPAVLAAAAPPTYNREIRPIFEKNCVACHSPGGAGPMLLNTYESVRPWTRQIKAMVTQKKMPPGVVQRHYGLFGDDGALSRQEIETIVQWVDAGAPEGSMQETLAGPGGSYR